MNKLTKATVLVLNRNWQALNVRTPQEAFCMMRRKVHEGNPRDIIEKRLQEAGV
jgi:hypothetical protein